MIKKFIESVRDEKDGFSFDKPWRLEEKSLGVLVPILRDSDEARDYMTFAEARGIKVEDTGQIDHVFIESTEGEPILISRGEIFRGKTQERAAIHDHIIPKDGKLRVAVRCIHASRGISRGADMEYGGRVPYAVGFKSQSETWENVSAYTSRAWEMSNTINATGGVMRTSFDAETNRDQFRSSDDLVSSLDGLTDAMKAALKKIPYIDNQAGAVFLYGNKMVGMDVYDLPHSWDAIKRDIVEKEGANFLKRDSDSEMFEFKEEKAVNLIKKYLSADFEEKEIYNREYKLTELRSDELIGEVIEYNGKVIHLTFWKKSEK